MPAQKIYGMKFADVYPLLRQKAERKGRTAREADQLTEWLTGYTEEQIAELLNSEITYGDFFRQAPALNPDRLKIRGSICRVKIQEIEDPLMRDIRCLDKLIDDLTKGKSFEKIIPEQRLL